MMRHRLIAAVAVLAVSITAGCTSSSDKHPGTGSAAGGSTPAAGSSGARALATSVRTALTTLTSSAVAIDAGGLIATTTGHIALTNGTATASQFRIGTGDGATQVITVGSAAYAKLPAGQNTSGKPYLKVSADSGNEFIRGLDSSLQILQAASSLGDLTDLIGEAGSFTDKGMTGSPSTHEYTFTITGDAKGSTLQKQLAELGSAPVPVDLFVNAQNLPVKIVLSINLAGSSLPVTATLSDFNAPLTIAAPPDNQVASG
jgi:hypothetical protein